MFDEKTILCGQFDGFFDVITIVDGRLEIVNSQQLNQIDDVHAIAKTLTRQDEVVIGGINGIFVGTIENNLLSLTQEIWLPGQCITQIFEVSPFTFLVGKRDDETYCMVNRSAQKTIVLASD